MGCTKNLSKFLSGGKRISLPVWWFIKMHSSFKLHLPRKGVFEGYPRTILLKITRASIWLARGCHLLCRVALSEISYLWCQLRDMLGSAMISGMLKVCQGLTSARYILKWRSIIWTTAQVNVSFDVLHLQKETHLLSCVVNDLSPIL